jgi:hypothetical protein
MWFRFTNKSQGSSWLPCAFLFLTTVICPSYSFSPQMVHRAASSAVSQLGVIKNRCLHYKGHPGLRLTGMQECRAKQYRSTLQLKMSYKDAADEASWLLANEDGECSVENAMYCGLAQSTEIASVLVGYMEECNGKFMPLCTPSPQSQMG